MSAYDDLRPPRNTPHLGLPVPGDAAAADAPTAIGNLADAIDALAAGGYVGQDTGDIKMSARINPPDGWLLCDGRLLSRSVFADLFAAIGVRYGAGDGNTTFAIPDYRNVFPMGAPTAGQAGERGGANSVTLTVSHVPAHAHYISAWTGTESADHTHGYGWPLDFRWNGMDPNPATYLGHGAAFNTGGRSAAHQHLLQTWTDNGNGGGAAHENRPTFAAVNFFIKT